MTSPPRRSTRSGAPPTKPAHTTSSSSSVTSSRPERAASTRGPHKPSPSPPTNDIAIDDGDEEEEASAEVTRCVCGKQEYPGAPIPLQNDPAGDGDLFIQCDDCNVWQHGGCVGIMDQNKTPDNYFCERCDKSFHQLHTDDNGQRYSLYLPFHEDAATKQRKSSTTRANDTKLRRERDMLAKVAAELGFSKRRSTTNSRHTYDEEEQLRKAIEESKRDQDVRGKGKRGRDDSDDAKFEVKRRRTGSESIEAGSTLNAASLDADSDDDAPSKSALKRARAHAAENQRQREIRDREKLKEQQREEAAGRRSQRAGRRRGDELDDDVKATPNLKAESIAPSSRPASPPEIEVTLPSSTHKKSAGKKVKRTGRNQYTKDRETSPTQHKNGSGSSGEEAGKGTDTNGSKHSPTSGVDQTNAAASTSHKAKGKQKAKGNAGVGAGLLDKNGKSKFTTWEAWNNQITYIEEYAQQVIAHYEAKAASDLTKRAQSLHINGSSSSSLAGQNSGPRRTTVTPLSTAHSAATLDDKDAAKDGPQEGARQVPAAAAAQEWGSTRDAKDKLTPLAEYEDMPTLEHARTVLKEVRMARAAFGVKKPDGPPRPDALKQANRDLGI